MTKQAFTYVFDRVTGEPVWPIVERPVPQSEVLGERTSPTQPFPTKPAPFDRQGVTLDDLIDFIPELRTEAIEIASDYKLGPIFTPPIVAGANGLRGALRLPNVQGGANWQGAAVDPETGMLYVASGTWTGVAAVTAPDPERSDMAYDCIKNHPALQGVELPSTGKPERSGIMVTKTLVFAGEGSGLRYVSWAGGPMFRAYDKMTGEIVWEFELPGNQTGNPMTYMIDGRQYIVVAVGARNQPAGLVALALP